MTTPVLKFIGLLNVLMLLGCNGSLDLTVKTNTSSGSSPITVDPNDPPTEDPTPTPAPSPGESPSPSPAPSPSPTPISGQKSQIFVSKALVSPTKANSRAFFEKICQKEASKAKLNGKFTALVGITGVKFTDLYSVPGVIYQKVGNDEIPVADSFQGLITGHNNAIFAAACGKRIDSSYYNLVWTGNLDFQQASRDDLNCKNWGSRKNKGVVGWMGGTGPEALSLRYISCDSYSRVYCIQVQ